MLFEKLIIFEKKYFMLTKAAFIWNNPVKKNIILLNITTV